MGNPSASGVKSTTATPRKRSDGSGRISERREGREEEFEPEVPVDEEADTEEGREDEADGRKEEAEEREEWNPRR